MEIYKNSAVHSFRQLIQVRWTFHLVKTMLVKSTEFTTRASGFGSQLCSFPAVWTYINLLLCCIFYCIYKMGFCWFYEYMDSVLNWQMTQQEKKVLTALFDHLNLLLTTHRVEGENRWPKVVLWSPHYATHIHTRENGEMQIKKILKNSVHHLIQWEIKVWHVLLHII